MSAVLQDTPPNVALPAQSGIELLDFYRTLLPASGLYALFSVPRKKHIWTDSLEVLVKATERVSGEADWYYAVAFVH